MEYPMSCETCNFIYSQQIYMDGSWNIFGKKILSLDYSENYGYSVKLYT